MLRQFIELGVITQDEIISLIGLEPIKNIDRIPTALTLPSSRKIETAGGFNYGSKMREA
jgi:hypothetical protein